MYGILQNSATFVLLELKGTFSRHLVGPVDQSQFFQEDGSHPNAFQVWKQFKTRAESCHGKGKQRKVEGSPGQSSQPIAPKWLVWDTVGKLLERKKEVVSSPPANCTRVG